ncbi:late embryogenesis abundant protein Lea5-D-like [Telopea speciosissima]|uniref:late embryogenesis abundant protein Lea5-D-like n=1 Tax=Telopea speciosissima TaxID=54955 RepID=UPI001CC3A37C|nr:late embryogenesis abundant protein Lea5-D-like [Telopea speciosissima]
MARFLCNANLVSSLVDSISVSINRRGYAVASQAISSSVVRGRSGLLKSGEERVAMKEASETNSWAPDPVTGYYRPQNCGAEMDVAELREMLLNNKTKQH